MTDKVVRPEGKKSERKRRETEEKQLYEQRRN